MSDIQILFRTPTVRDYNFLISSWTKSARHAFPDVDDKVYYQDYKSKVRDLLANKDTLLAVDPEDSSIILGFMTYEPNIIHYVYVKHALRGFGIAKQLSTIASSEIPTTVTILTSHAKKYMAKHPGYITYNPFLK
jgi:hypothetical protein